MSADFLVELGTEELPPKALKSLSNAFTDGVVSGLRDLGLNYKDVRSFAALRRLAITISELDAQTPNKDLVIWGPPVKVAFSDDGTPSKAAEAFAKKNGVTIKELASLIDNDGQQDKLCIRRTENGVDTKTCLADIINRSLAKLPIPRRMRWGYKKEEFVRPAQWAVLLFNDEVLHDSILGITASNTSRGHRFHANQEILIKSPSSYQQQLRDAYVIADFNQRRELITKGVESLAKEINGIAVLENDLLDEVAALNEWPVPLMGEFDEHFLSIPAQALISSMKEHQKYFHVLDAKDQLLPAFITVANIESTDPAQVIDGNERVIRPRLADAAFFYENDKKTTLKSRRSSLKNIVFQYGKNQEILKDVNIIVNRGDFIGVKGESGSGKTSLIMLAGGLEKVTSGKIFFEDHEISKMSEDEVSKIRRKNIGIVFQSFYLIPNYTAVENVALTLELNSLKNPNERAKELLDRFGLKNRFNNLPSQLSGGEQQRVAIARAIAMKPKLILADEPTGNLDSENSQMIADILFKYIKEEKSSLIVVTHDPKLANKAKRKIKIKDGKIV